MKVVFVSFVRYIPHTKLHTTRTFLFGQSWVPDVGWVYVSWGMHRLNRIYETQFIRRSSFSRSWVPGSWVGGGWVERTKQVKPNKGCVGFDNNSWTQNKQWYICMLTVSKIKSFLISVWLELYFQTLLPVISHNMVILVMYSVSDCFNSITCCLGEG